MADHIVNGVYEAVKFVFQDEKGRILIEKRSKDKKVLPGIWAIPAGHVDSGDLKHSDYLLHALHRECMEELNLVPNYVRYINKRLLKVLDRQYRVFYYLCKGFDKSAIPRVSNEGARLKWLNPKDSEALFLEIDRSILSRLSLTITVTGTPGTGKTTMAKALAESLNMGYLGLSEAISRYKLSSGYDKQKSCEIVSISVLRRFVREYCLKHPNSWVIDGHLSHYLDSDLCIVCRTGLKALKKRLEDRKYTPEKVRGNLDSEIFDVCGAEAREFKRNTLFLDTTNTKTSTLVTKAVSALKLF